MFVIIGIVVVIGAIVGGYLMEHGNLRVLMQPAELLIIAGAAAGTVLIANPPRILKKMAGGFAGLLKARPSWGRGSTKTSNSERCWPDSGRCPWHRWARGQQIRTTGRICQIRKA